MCFTEAKSGICDQKSGTRPQKAGRMVTLMLAEVRGYTSETINCPEGTDDLKVWENLS